MGRPNGRAGADAPDELAVLPPHLERGSSPHSGSGPHIRCGPARPGPPAARCAATSPAGTSRRAAPDGRLPPAAARHHGPTGRRREWRELRGGEGLFGIGGSGGWIIRRRSLSCPSRGFLRIRVGSPDNAFGIRRIGTGFPGPGIDTRTPENPCGGREFACTSRPGNGLAVRPTCVLRRAVWRALSIFPSHVSSGARGHCDESGNPRCGAMPAMRPGKGYVAVRAPEATGPADVGRRRTGAALRGIGSPAGFSCAGRAGMSRRGYRHHIGGLALTERLCAAGPEGARGRIASLAVALPRPVRARPGGPFRTASEGLRGVASRAVRRYGGERAHEYAARNGDATRPIPNGDRAQ